MKLNQHGWKLMSAGTVLAFALAGCAPTPTEPEAPTETTMDNNAVGTAMPEMISIKKAIAVIHPTKGHDVKGAISFTQEEDGLHIVGDITGLTPGEHGFHAHENGDCSAEGSSAGGHFNPEDIDHGAEDASPRHVGDFGNITADESGNARIDKVDKMAKLNGNHSIVGRAIIIHADADDLKSQPSGEAGARVACGVVGVTK